MIPNAGEIGYAIEVREGGVPVDEEITPNAGEIS